jgi:GNAT superfamily N-acetyltransferase
MIVGLFHVKEDKKKMIGMARVVGDGDTNMLNDVYVLKEFQGTGLGVKFLQLLFDGNGRDIWRWMLFTGDRKDWYIKKFGFVVMGNAFRSKMAHIPLYMLERDGRALKYLEEEQKKNAA